MTPRYPGAFWLPVSATGKRDRMPNGPDTITYHEAVSPNPTSVRGWVEGQAACQGYNGKNGRAEQYFDFDEEVAGVAEGNDHCITWESYDGLKPINDANGYREVQQDDPAIYGTSANTGVWDPGQCERFADIGAWSLLNLNIPLALLPDSKPGRSGHGPHRLGIDPWRADGGELWTRHPGKPCPGNLRILQIPGILARAKVIAEAVQAGRCSWLPPGEVDLPSALARTNTQPNEGELTMAQIDDIDRRLTQIAKALTTRAQGVIDPDTKKPSSEIGDAMVVLLRVNQQLVNEVNELRGALVNAGVIK
jgi:hypothetical protein